MNTEQINTDIKPPVALHIHIGKLIELIEIAIPGGHSQEEQQRLGKKGRQIVACLKEKLLQSLANFQEFGPFAHDEEFQLSIHLQ